MLTYTYTLAEKFTKNFTELMRRADQKDIEKLKNQIEEQQRLWGINKVDKERLSLANDELRRRKIESYAKI